MIRLLMIVAAAVLLATQPGIAAPEAGPRAQLKRGRTLWNAQNLRDYSFRLRLTCFCPEAGRGVTITVRDGRARGATGFRRTLDTVPELFAQIERALKDPRAGKVTVRYDRRRGFPRSASIDRIKNAIDDELAWTIDRFRAR